MKKLFYPLLFSLSLMLCFQTSGCAQADAPYSFDEPIVSAVTAAGEPTISIPAAVRLEPKTMTGSETDAKTLPVYPKSGATYHPMWLPAGDPEDPSFPMTRNDPPRFPVGLVPLGADPCDWVVDGSLCACRPCEDDTACGGVNPRCSLTNFQLDPDPKVSGPSTARTFQLACCRPKT